MKKHVAWMWIVGACTEAGAARDIGTSAEDAVEVASETVSEVVSEVVSETVSEVVSETVSETVSEVASETVSEWSANLVVSPVAATTIAGTAYASASRLDAAWSAPAGSVNGFRIRAREGALVHAEVLAAANATSAQLTGLDASTHYDVSIEACLDAACGATLTPVDTASVAADTAEQVWQFRGTGAAVAGLKHIVSDGNVRVHAIRYGDGAPAGSEGHVQLYYGPMPPTKGLAVATAAAAATTDPSTFDSFTSLAATSGLHTPPNGTALLKDIGTAQAVPVTAALGGGIRLYVEASGTDGHARIMHFDSVDGYVGLDFNRGAATVCATTVDYGTAGDCAPTLDLGVDGDALLPSAKLKNVRQFKIGVRTLDDWRWDGAVGSFMVVTTDKVDGCSVDGHNQAYAVWDGARWNIQYATDGCPKLMTQTQAATPLHLGGGHYALYYGDRSDLSARPQGQHPPYLGPKRVRFAHGEATGEAGVIDFEDWETAEESHALTFLWPSGGVLDAVSEGYIDDFVALTPTDSVDIQVLYAAVTDGTEAPFASIAVLVNP